MPSPLDPVFTVFEHDPYTEVLQAEAIGEIMTLPPYEKQALIGSYGSPPACQALVRVVLRGMRNPVSSWATTHHAVVRDIDRPFVQPEAFRLEAGVTIWPNPDHIALLVPLSTHSASIELQPRGTDYVIPVQWHPNLILFLNETGLRFSGDGSVRFIYIILYKLAQPPVAGWETYTV